MKYWFDEIISSSDTETAKITIQAFSGALLFVAIIAGNWNLIT